MPIDKITINLYICCKCGYQWTNWDGKNKQEGPVPHYCPKCKNLRWDQRYTQEEDSLFDQVHEQHTVKRVKKVSEYDQLLARMRGQNADSKNHMVTVDYVDMIAYDFLYEINPQPDMFELKQLLAIPRKNIEARHEYMLSIIHDRIDNADKYENERFSKYGDSYLWYGHNKRYHGLDKPLGQPKHKSEKPIKGCKHTIQKVRKLEKLFDQRKETNRKKIRAKRDEEYKQRFEQMTEGQIEGWKEDPNYERWLKSLTPGVRKYWEELQERRKQDVAKPL
jgi:hypothetical protein